MAVQAIIVAPVTMAAPATIAAALLIIVVDRDSMVLLDTTGVAAAFTCRLVSRTAKSIFSQASCFAYLPHLCEAGSLFL